jgi:hypothetical protein
MYNQVILDKFIEKHGLQRAVEICDILSQFYDIKYEGCKTQECLEEYDYERSWWSEASFDLMEKHFNNS